MMRFKLMSDKMSPSITRIKKDLRKVAPEAYKTFVNATPKNSGNARSKTTLARNEIRANYPYARVLDKGYSKKAPRGMTAPTVAFIKRIFNSIVRK